ncbi:MAG: (2Fe-2S)-binding protein [Bacillota bacterium]|jgi:NAD(P)H-nitrite reductase large subunit|nr:(2Fe-2S)-binding protein [Clostridiales bacterium]MBR6700258.1 (2Fe-2S)-binding protein [Bacillota bacterium]MDO4481502.1 (2Fe-2S)-binding protein [Bacillota bacterium]
MARIDDEMLVCRCEEVTVGEIREAIAQGAFDVVGVKRRTRAGMGLCQGRTCEKMVQQLISQELGVGPHETGSTSVRPPVRPISYGALAEGVF